MRALVFTLLLGACTFERPADVTFGNAAITITEGDRQTGVVDTRLPLSLKVNVTDADFLPIENFTVEFAVRDGNGTFVEDNRANEKSMDEVRTDAQGNARIDLRMGTRSGELFVDVSGEGIEGNEPVFFTHTALADVPVQISAYAGNGESATVATQLAAPLVARVEDRFGNPSPAGVEVTFAVASGGGTLATPTGTSAADGTVSSLITLGTAAGPTTIEATASGLTPATFTVNGLADVAVSMERTSPQALLATALRPSDEMIVTARDTYGNPAPGVTINFERTAGTGTLTATTVVTDADGRAVNTYVAPSLLATATITVTGALTGSGFTFTATTRGYRPAQSIATGSKVTRSTAVGDLNADGLPDLVAATVLTTPTAFSGFTVYMNTTTPGATTASFSAGTQIAVPNVNSSTARISIVDATGDGSPDVIISTGNAVVLHPNTTAANTTTPTFGPTVQFNAGNGRPVLVDLNEDQLLDMILVNSPTANLYRRTGAAFSAFSNQGGSILSVEDDNALFIGNINGDTKPDVGTFDFVYLTSYSNMSNATSLSFAGTNLQPGSTVRGSLVDINGDGKADWVAGSGGSNYILLNTTVTTPAYTALASPPTGIVFPTVFDMNGDGLLDIVGTNNSSQIRVALNTGTATAPTFAAAESLPSTNLSSSSYTVLADINKDGKTDFVVDNGTSSVGVILAQ